MDGEHLQNASVARWQTLVATTLGAWLAAFLVVTALLRLFGDQLGSLPLELRALVLSGVLVTLMANVVMPALTTVVGRWVAEPQRDRPTEVRSPRDDRLPPTPRRADIGQLPRGVQERVLAEDSMKVQRGFLAPSEIGAVARVDVAGQLIQRADGR